MCNEEWVADNLYPIDSDHGCDCEDEEEMEYAYAHMFAYYFGIDRKFSGNWIVRYTVYEGCDQVDIESREFDLRADAFGFIENMWLAIWEEMTSEE